MYQILALIVTLCLCSCTLLKKDGDSDEMAKMGEMVLKSKEGLEIDFKPVPVEKK